LFVVTQTRRKRHVAAVEKKSAGDIRRVHINHATEKKEICVAPAL
jgi:hypothetical protein